MVARCCSHPVPVPGFSSSCSGRWSNRAVGAAQDIKGGPRPPSVCLSEILSAHQDIRPPYVCWWSLALDTPPGSRAVHEAFKAAAHRSTKERMRPCPLYPRCHITGADVASPLGLCPLWALPARHHTAVLTVSPPMRSVSYGCVHRPVRMGAGRAGSRPEAESGQCALDAGELSVLATAATLSSPTTHRHHRDSAGGTSTEWHQRDDATLLTSSACHLFSPVCQCFC